MSRVLHFDGAHAADAPLAPAIDDGADDQRLDLSGPPFMYLRWSD
jgi:hypothetical protein